VDVDIDQYYRRYGPLVLQRCRRLLGDDDEAMDAMQDTFVRLMRYQDRLTGRSPGALLHRMATNVCLNRVRASKSRPTHPDGELLTRIAGADAPERTVWARLGLQRLFAGEPEDSRTMAVMVLLDGHTHEQVAALVGLSVSGVRYRLRRLRGQIRELEGGKDAA